ncbi:unnamed protein product [Protopolystoma xenopodis]|uniref:Myotubularin phosphatase domain-containing protein n=1 Tax=Protopolystoma xenopodis TaxID=117903 RepID=A0A3S5CM25_9PLAT|nr:unnamed protein product [Protopolystoma xenopodis]
MLIERDWVRQGYPFAPDPSDWQKNASLLSSKSDFGISSTVDYDSGAAFALFLDCTHQLLVQFPTEFAFTEVS